MDKLLTSALQIRQRTKVTSLFADNGYKIAMTDFDDVVFERQAFASTSSLITTPTQKPFQFRARIANNR